MGLPWYRQEIWVLEVEYERFVRATVSEGRYERVSGWLYDFLKAYPEKKKPSDFYVCDVEDWASRLTASGLSKRTVTDAVHAIAAFYNWMAETKHLQVVNPAIRRQVERAAAPVSRVTLDNIERLTQAAVTPRQKLLVAEVLACKSPQEIAQSLGASPETARRMFRELRQESGFPVPMKDAPRALSRLYWAQGKAAVLSQHGSVNDANMEPETMRFDKVSDIVEAKALSLAVESA